MRGRSRALRAISVAAFAIAPLAAVDISNAAVETGDANANGPGVAIENTGGNVELGKGHSESRVVLGDPASAPAARTIAPGALTTKAKPVIPGSDAVARAKALVAAARARAQQQIDEARQMAEEAQQKAHDQSDEARARSDAQSAEARSRSQQSSASADSSAD